MNEGNDENIKKYFLEIEQLMDWLFKLAGWSFSVKKGWNLRYLSKIRVEDI